MPVTNIPKSPSSDYDEEGSDTKPKIVMDNASGQGARQGHGFTGHDLGAKADYELRPEIVTESGSASETGPVECVRCGVRHTEVMEGGSDGHEPW